MVVSWLVVLAENLPSNFVESEGASGIFAGFRLFRIGKLVRPLRVVAQFRTLWLLVRGLLATALTVIYTFMLLFLFLYIFACIAIEIMAKDWTGRDADPEYDELISLWFPDMFTTIVSLSQFVTCDSIAVIYRDIVIKKPFMAPYFTLLVLVMSISLMNLVTALIVEGSLAQSATEKSIERNMRLKEYDKKAPQLREVFVKLDADHSGSISVNEILQISGSDAELLLNVIPADDMADLFDILDQDGSGEIEYDEFLESLKSIIASDLP